MTCFTCLCICRPSVTRAAVHIGRVAPPPELLSLLLGSQPQPAQRTTSSSQIPESTGQFQQAEAWQHNLSNGLQPDVNHGRAGSTAYHGKGKTGTAVVFADVQSLFQLLPKEVGLYLAHCVIWQ